MSLLAFQHGGVADHYIDNHVPFIALRDGQALVINREIRGVVE
jgi:hypothetical protein